jgi:hypothetical protein
MAANDDFADRTLLAPTVLLVEPPAATSVEPGEGPGWTARDGTRWWTWVAPATGPARFQALGPQLMIHTGAAPGALTAVTTPAAEHVIAVTAGVPYHIQARYFGQDDGETTLGVGMLVPPSNDAFAAAANITGAAFQAPADNRFATRETGEPLHAGEVGSRSLWWRWTAPANGRVTVRVDQSEIWIPLLAVYRGSAVNALALVAAQPGVAAAAQLQFDAIAGATYHVVVDGWHAATGTFRLGLTQDVLPTPGQPASNGAGFAMTVSGLPGQNFIVQYSTDLVIWHDLEPGVVHTVPPGGSLALTDPALEPLRFYRVLPVE